MVTNCFLWIKANLKARRTSSHSVIPNSSAAIWISAFKSFPIRKHIRSVLIPPTIRGLPAPGLLPPIFVFPITESPMFVRNGIRISSTCVRLGRIPHQGDEASCHTRSHNAGVVLQHDPLNTLVQAYWQPSSTQRDMH